MLPKIKRLTTEEFKNVFKGGRRYSTASLLCVYQDSQKGAVSTAVTKKNYPRAVDRNRLRRLVYSCVGEIPSDKKIIIIVKKKIPQEEESTLCAEVISFMHSL